jgi:DNA-binding transcriptional MerR regulator
MQNQFLFVGETARTLGVSEKTVRKLEARGELHAERAANGIRIFKGEEVRKFARELIQKDRKLI